jgi:hypothetical protein
MSDARLRWLLTILICVATGLAFGLSYGYGSNHQVYVPPGLHLADPSFLAHDWWLTSTVHYHWAFSVLVAVLAQLNVVPWGLALLNVAAVAGSLFVCHLLFRRWIARWDLLALALLASLFLLTQSFQSVARTYLFTSSLQASSVSTVATLAAILCLVKARYGWSALWLALGGAFHANFLLINLPFFGLAYGFMRLPQWRNLPQHWRAWGKEVTILLGPSLLVVIATLPLIFSITDQTNDPETVAIARFALFEFAAPFHYLPRTFLMNFVELLGWQILGVAWTSWAVPEPSQRRVIWALQLALFVLLWGATALTTVVFIEPVSRLFFWRLAPFAELLAALLIIAGTLRALCSQPSERTLLRLWPLGLSVIGILLIALLLRYRVGVTDPIAAMQLLIIAGMVGAVGVHWWWSALLAPIRRIPAVAIFASVALLWLAATALSATPEGFSLLVRTAVMYNEETLFAFVRNNTPVDAQFLIPPNPNMRFFRLKAERAIVVDARTVPFGDASLAEWYHRLEAVSGTERPSNLAAVLAGYYCMDEARLTRLRVLYGVTHIVLPAKQVFSANGWREIYRNGAYQVLEYQP